MGVSRAILAAAPDGITVETQKTLTLALSIATVVAAILLVGWIVGLPVGWP